VRLLSVEQAAERLNVAPRSLIDRRYRMRIKLSAIKIGRRVGFVEEDIDRLIQRGREHLPGEGQR